MANFWATDFWADGFWADGFWFEDEVEAGVFVDAYGPIASYPIMAPEDYLNASGVGDGGDSANINDRLYAYLQSAHVPGVYASADFMTLLQYDLAQREGDATARFQALIADASA